MAGVNSILKFAGNATGNNILTDANYSADNQRSIGNQPGVARQDLINKVLLQSTSMAELVGQLIADYQSANVTDSLSAAQLETMFVSALTQAAKPPTSTGTAGAYNVSSQGIGAYVNGNIYSFIPHVSNTGATTVDFGAGAVSVKLIDGSNPLANDLIPAAVSLLRYNGTSFILQNPRGAGSPFALKAGNSAEVFSVAGGVAAQQAIPYNQFQLIAAAGGDESDLNVGAYQNRLSVDFVASGAKVFITAHCAVNHVSTTANDFLMQLEIFDVTTGASDGSQADGASAANASLNYGAKLVCSLTTGNLTPGHTYRAIINLQKLQSNGPTYPRDMRIDGVNF